MVSCSGWLTIFVSTLIAIRSTFVLGSTAWLSWRGPATPLSAGHDRHHRPQSGLRQRLWKAVEKEDQDHLSIERSKAFQVNRGEAKRLRRQAKACGKADAFEKLRDRVIRRQDAKARDGRKGLGNDELASATPESSLFFNAATRTLNREGSAAAESSRLSTLPD